jgi:hypothetical protein
MDSGYEGYQSSLLLSPPFFRVPEVTIGFKDIKDIKDLSSAEAR